MRSFMRALGVLLLVVLVAVQASAQSPQTSGVLTAAGTCPNTIAVSLPVSGLGAVAIQLTGTWVGTVTFYGSLTGQTFVALTLIPSTGTTPASTATGNGVWSGHVGGYGQVCAAFSSYTSGSAFVMLQGALEGGR